MRFGCIHVEDDGIEESVLLKLLKSAPHENRQWPGMKFLDIRWGVVTSGDSIESVIFGSWVLLYDTDVLDRQNFDCHAVSKIRIL